MAIFSFTSQVGEAGLKELYLDVTFGATGAVASIGSRVGFGAVYPAPPNSLASIVRNSAGNYTINFDQRWQACKGFGVKIKGGPTAVGDGTTPFVITENLTAAQPNIVIEYRAYNSGTTAADPTNGSVHTLYFALKDSTV